MIADRFDTARSVTGPRGVVPFFIGAALIGLYGNAMDEFVSRRH
jgi:hypothetical protein